MVKLNLSPWLSSWSSHTRSNVERKKLNRRTFPGFSPSSTLAEVDISNSKPASSTTSCENTMAIREPTTTGATNSMVALAEKISRETAKLESHIKQRGLPMPSFDVDSPGDFPKLPDEIQMCRIEIVNATKQLRDLAVGPRESIRWGVWDFLDVLALQIIYGFGLAKLVPLDKPIHLNDLQKLTPLDPVNLARTLRTAMTNHIFTEPSPDMIAHTAASRLLATDSELAAWVGFNTDDIFPAANGVLTALRTHPEATSLTQSGFQYAFNTVDIEPMFTTFGHDAERARRMGLAMASLTGGEGYEVSYFVDEYDLGDIDVRGGLLVDVGGSHGFVSVSLARKWKNMRFIVQDLEKTVDSAPRPICEDSQVADRVKFMSHDFFTPQTVAADVYYFRWIIHNYSTPYAVSILRNLIPVLRPGNRIIINDHCLRDPGKENAWDEKIMRRMDMVMLTLLNAQERTEADFKELFRLADDGFVFKGVTRPNGCRMSIVEAVWKPDEYVPMPA